MYECMYICIYVAEICENYLRLISGSMFSLFDKHVQR
jgi:hypothetical protein